jgi:anti-repressor protein
MEYNENNQLQTFFYNEKKVRTACKDGQPLWMLKDVCDAMKIRNSGNVVKRLNKDDIHLMDTVDSVGRQQQMIMINEGALYSVILRSDKPEARKFEHWITHEVLPQIRKHGAYITTSKTEEIMNDPDVWIEMISAIKKERAEKEQLKICVEEYKPKALFADAVSATKDTILIRDLAKILKGNGIDVGEKRLFKRLRKDGFLIKKEGADFNSPTQKSMELGLFELAETAILHNSGATTISKTSRVTGKGQQYFVNYFINEKGDENAAN